MPTVRLSFSPAPAHVRTARLVGVAVARRSGLADELLDEVRLAIGEACSRAVALHRRHHLRDMIEIVIAADERFTVTVTDRAPIDAVLGAQLPDPADLPDPMALLDGAQQRHGVTEAAEEDVVVGMGFALLAGLVDDLSVRPTAVGAGTDVCMSWPISARRA